MLECRYTVFSFELGNVSAPLVLVFLHYTEKW